MTLHEIIQHMTAYRRAHPEQREGQAYFNAVHEVWPNVADSIRGTDADPYYDDSRVRKFVSAVNDALEGM